MPPKKKPEAPSKKADQKKKERVIEVSGFVVHFVHSRSNYVIYFQDKTFGLKNKKGAKQQKFIQQVQNQVKFGNNPKKVTFEFIYL